MTHYPTALYAALAARDRRFDGLFFVGVTSTGIYCRPVCTARTPKRANCRFFPSAAAAELAAFRPCLRCRPELAPGGAPVDGARRVAEHVMHRIGEGALGAEGALGGGAWLDRLAAEFGISGRQLRRVVQRELGVSPMELVLTRRLLLARQLLSDTRLPVIEVAYASGFASLRRFNDAFRRRYGMPPSRLRRGTGTAAALPVSGGEPATLTLQLGYRPPFDWHALLAFLEARALRGVERVSGGTYARTVRLADAHGWLRVADAPDRSALRVELSHALLPVLPAVLARLRALFDLDAHPDSIAAHLARDARLAPHVDRRPGLRVPGAFDGFELAVRAILGQQVTVRHATTLAGRFVEAFGEPAHTPIPELARATPAAARVAAADPAELVALGIVNARARAIIALAGVVARGALRLQPGVDPEATIARLRALPGVGPWTAHYIAMRALRWPDAFPKEDAVLRTRLGAATPRLAAIAAESWRPWRSYGALHLWCG